MPGQAARASNCRAAAAAANPRPATPTAEATKTALMKTAAAAAAAVQAAAAGATDSLSWQLQASDRTRQLGSHPGLCAAYAAAAAALQLLQVTRNVYDAATGKYKPESEVLEVPIKPGWKAGTRITFAGSATACSRQQCSCLSLEAEQFVLHTHSRQNDSIYLLVAGCIAGGLPSLCTGGCGGCHVPRRQG